MLACATLMTLSKSRCKESVHTCHTSAAPKKLSLRSKLVNNLLAPTRRGLPQRTEACRLQLRCAGPPAAQQLPGHDCPEPRGPSAAEHQAPSLPHLQQHQMHSSHFAWLGVLRAPCDVDTRMMQSLDRRLLGRPLADLVPCRPASSLARPACRLCQTGDLKDGSGGCSPSNSVTCRPASSLRGSCPQASLASQECSMLPAASRTEAARSPRPCLTRVARWAQLQQD